MGVEDVSDRTAVGAADDETTVVPDAAATQSAAALAWSAGDASPPVRRPVPRSARLALAAVGVIAVTVAAFTLGTQRSPQRATPPNPPPPALHPSSPPTAPALPLLDGMYRLEYRWAETRNALGAPNSLEPVGPPVEWWAFTSACMPTGCVALGKFLDLANHEIAAAPPAAMALQLMENAWSFAITPTRRAKCAHRDLTAIQSLTIALHPLPDGTFAGSFTQREETPECGDQGASIITPVMLARVGPVPPSVITRH